MLLALTVFLIINSPAGLFPTGCTLFSGAVLCGPACRTGRHFYAPGRLNALRTAIKLRGGTASANLFRNLAAAGTYLGMAFITAVDYNERGYRVMLLRGYRGDIGETERQTLGKAGGYVINVAIILFSSIFFMVTVLW